MKTVFPIAYFAILVSSTFAQDAVVTTLADSGPGSLREAIDPSRSSGTITFDPTLNGGTILMAPGSTAYSITTRPDFTIDATDLPGGITIDANTSPTERRRIFEIGVMSASSRGLTLKGITLTGGWAADGVDSSPGVSADFGENGGAIFSEGNLVLEDCTFRGNRSGRGGRGTAGGRSTSGKPGGDGGAYYGLNGSLSILRCIFIDNHTGDGGDGILTDPSGDSFGGGGGDGGALYIEVGSNDNVPITDCIFTGNSAGDGANGGNGKGRGGSGGAIYSQSGLTISNTRITGNRSGNGGTGADGGDGGDGGAIYVSGFGRPVIGISMSTIENNATGLGGIGGSPEVGGSGGNGGRGGGVYSRYTLLIDRSTFANNSSGDGGDPNPGTRSSGDGGAGGAIFCDASSSAINDSLFVGNATGSGGFSGRPGLGGNGGAIVNDDELSLVNCTFTRNTTGDGGYRESDFLFASGAGRGAAVYNSDSLSIDSCTMIDNLLGTDGIGDPLSRPTAGASLWTNDNVATVRSSVATGSISGILTGASAGNFTSGDPQLLPLGDYGGATRSRPPMPGSPLVDPAGGAATTSSAEDQRGSARVVGGILDIGSVEYQGAAGELSLTFSLDSDGDGVPNGIELGIDTNPYLSDRSHPNHLRVETSANGSRFYNFGYATETAGLLSLYLTRSTDLAAFGAPLYDSDTAPAQSSVSVEDPSPDAAATYYRLEAIQK